MGRSVVYRENSVPNNFIRNLEPAVLVLDLERMDSARSVQVHGIPGLFWAFADQGPKIGPPHNVTSRQAWQKSVYLSGSPSTQNFVQSYEIAQSR